LDPIRGQLDPKTLVSSRDTAMTDQLLHASGSRAERGPRRPLDLQLVAIGGVGGVLSGLLGVGGGVIMVPLLVLWAGYGQREAHAMSLGAIIPISIAGILTFGLAGRVHWLDAIALAIGAVAGARFGAALLTRIDERTLRIVFGCFLVAAAIAMGAHA
jgi:uncharacterized membrane protein YfcA